MWKVDTREITFLGTEYNEEAYRTGNLTQFFRHRTMSLIAGDTSRRAYTTIGERNPINDDRTMKNRMNGTNEIYEHLIGFTQFIQKEELCCFDI